MQPLEFGAYLRQMLHRKGISASELARTMGYKSRNTIFRILDEEGSHASRQAFFDRLIEIDALGLDDAQREELAAALEISRVGADVYQDNLAMAELFGGKSGGIPEAIHILSREEQPQNLTLLELLEAYTDSEELTLEISGCCSRIIFDTLRKALLDRKHSCRVTVTHYLYMGPDEFIANIAAIQPMLFAPCYRVYGIKPGTYSPERERIYRNNCICAQVTLADGTGYDEAIIQADRNKMIRFERRKHGGFLMVGSMLEDESLKEHPIKSNFAPVNPSEDLLTYVDECRQLEHNRAIYNVKLDMPIGMIHPDLLVCAVRDGFRDSGFAQEADMEALIGRLYDIHLERWNNYFVKRKPTYMIFSRKAMEDFARTGRQTDHFFALRPFTTEERRRILMHIRGQTEKNPDFCIHFFRDGVEPPNMEIGLYEGAGVLLSKAYTNYDLAGDHAEAIIAQSGFCQRFKAYFMEDLLARRVLSREETIALLDELIAGMPD